MKAHSRRLEALWKNYLAKLDEQPITQAEYESWRIDPVTIRMFAELESFQQALLESNTLQYQSPDEVHYTLGVMSGTAMVIASVFEWKPPGVELETDEDDEPNPEPRRGFG